jgi:hypothetical protein
MAYKLVIKEPWNIPHIDEAPIDFHVYPALNLNVDGYKLKIIARWNAILTWLITQDTDYRQQSV